MPHGALLAVEEVNRSPEFDFTFAPKFANPAGDLDQYRLLCEDMLRTQGVRHVVGCYTSSGRNEVLPVFEKLDALLWYPSHYEGFESCNNVIYAGGAPNQHIVPLIGESSYAFLRAYYEAGRRNALFDPAAMPVTSCNLSEPELLAVGGQAALGHIASSVYFQSMNRVENRAFVTRFKARIGAD